VGSRRRKEAETADALSIRLLTSSVKNAGQGRPGRKIPQFLQVIRSFGSFRSFGANTFFGARFNVTPMRDTQTANRSTEDATRVGQPAPLCLRRALWQPAPYSPRKPSASSESRFRRSRLARQKWINAMNTYKIESRESRQAVRPNPRPAQSRVFPLPISIPALLA